MKKFAKIYYITLGVFILVLILTVLVVVLHPLVRKGVINYTEYLVLISLDFKDDSQKLQALAQNIYNKSRLYEDKDKKIENYSIYLYERSAKIGNNESKIFLGAYNIFVKNNIKKGIEYLESVKANKNLEGEAKYLLGLYYIIKGENEDKGLDLLKEAKTLGSDESRKLLERTYGSVDFEKMEIALNELKDKILEKSNNHIEFGVINIF